MSVQDVRKAAADLVAAFARNDRAAYFGAFTADASFKRQRAGTQQEQGLWLACHEHLSAMPQGLPSP